jgi:serine/threonine-protein kinase RsbW
MTAAETLDHCVVADAVSVGRVRQEFSRWLRQFGLSADRHNDLVLAVNEALANVAEFAYLHEETPGLVRLSAQYDRVRAALTVTIADQGHWREPIASDIPDLRGRGIPLMRSLADDAEIETNAHGTTVRLRFDRVGDSVGDMAEAL